MNPIKFLINEYINDFYKYEASLYHPSYLDSALKKYVKFMLLENSPIIKNPAEFMGIPELREYLL